MPFEIPESWCWCKLSDVCNFESGYAFSSDDYKDKGTPLVRISNIQDGLVSLDNCVYIEGDIDKRFIINNGDLLIAMSGATTGKMGVYQYDCPALLNQRVGNIKVNTSLLLQKYRDYFMQSQGDLILKLSYGGAQPNVSAKIISDLFIPIPSLNEQEKIVAEIEKWFGFIDEIENGKIELESHIKKTKSKILDLAISGKLVPQDSNDEPAIELLKRINPDFEPCDNSHYENLPFEIPSTWVWVSHNDMLEISGGAQPPKSEFSEIMKPGYIRLYQIRDYGEKPIPIYIPLSTASKTTVKGDILLARYGGSLGKVFIAEDGAYNVAMAKVILCYPEVLNQKFVYYYYLSSIYQNKLRSISRTAQAGFNSGDFEDMYFPLPPLEEQGRIVDAISSIWEMIDMITAEL